MRLFMIRPMVVPSGPAQPEARTTRPPGYPPSGEPRPLVTVARNLPIALPLDLYPSLHPRDAAPWPQDIAPPARPMPQLPEGEEGFGPRRIVPEAVLGLGQGGGSRDALGALCRALAREGEPCLLIPVDERRLADDGSLEADFRRPRPGTVAIPMVGAGDEALVE